MAHPDKVDPPSVEPRLVDHPVRISDYHEEHTDEAEGHIDPQRGQKNPRCEFDKDSPSDPKPELEAEIVLSGFRFITPPGRRTHNWFAASFQHSPH